MTFTISLLVITSLLVGAPKKDIVNTAIEAGSFKTLVTAVKAAAIDTLKGDGPFTVFATTDEAFAKLSSCTLESLLKSENKDKLSDLNLPCCGWKSESKESTSLILRKTI